MIMMMKITSGEQCFWSGLRVGLGRGTGEAEQAMHYGCRLSGS